MRLKLLTAALALAMATANAAQAGDVRCLWDGLTSPTREALLDAAVHKPRNTKAMNDELDRVVAGCGVKDTRAGARALAGYVLEQSSARWLESKAGLDSHKLDAAWDSLSPQVRSSFSAAALRAPNRDAANDPAPREEILAIMKALDLKDTVTAKKVVTYYVGRAIRLDAESRL